MISLLKTAKKHPLTISVQFSVAFHIETSQLICNADQMTVFYVKLNTGLRWVKILSKVLRNTAIKT